MSNRKPKQHTLLALKMYSDSRNDFMLLTTHTHFHYIRFSARNTIRHIKPKTRFENLLAKNGKTIYIFESNAHYFIPTKHEKTSNIIFTDTRPKKAELSTQTIKLIAEPLEANNGLQVVLDFEVIFEDNIGYNFFSIKYCTFKQFKNFLYCV